jgi:hypothetical protein
MNGEDDYLEARAIHLIREAERARAISLDLHEIEAGFCDSSVEAPVTHE